MGAVVADHTKKNKQNPTCGPPAIALYYSKKKVRVFVRFNLNLD